MNISTLPVYQTENLTISTDSQPIGGFRGDAGTLKIEHKDHKRFTDWTQNELAELSHIVQKAVNIYLQANISNILIYAKQEGDQTQFNLIPYPKCNLSEKIQGSIHAIFGGSTLSQGQQEKITSFFTNKFSENIDPQLIQNTAQIKPDVFCNPSIIQKQLITDIIQDGKTYHLMHDVCPKGRHSSDPHLLIVPDQHEGHLQQEGEITQQRLHLLTIAQKGMQILLGEGNEATIFIQRIGNKLQSVPHTHVHTIGISEFPKTFLDKCTTLFRLLLPSKLTSESLQDSINLYQSYQWNVSNNLELNFKF